MVEPPIIGAGARATSPTAAPARYWLLLSLLVATAHGVLGLREAFSSPYIIQSDARQYVTWMERFIDPELFQHDLIADYFEAVSPPGYSGLYWSLAAVGVDPIVLSKVAPLVLGLITTAYAFALCLSLLPYPPGAFAAAVILSQSLWMTDDLISATPRAFGYPLLLAFLYYLARRSLPGCLIAIALEGLFYPQVAAVSAGALGVLSFRWWGGGLALAQDRRFLAICLGGVLVALIVLWLSGARASDYGPAISAAEAKRSPEFLPDGRAEFFFEDPWEFWITSQRSGFMPQQFGPPLVWAGLLLPMLILGRKYFPLARRICSEASLLAAVVVASFALFFAAHATLFRLYLPGRYTQHSLRVVLAISAGLALGILFERGWAYLQRPKWTPRARLASLTAAAGVFAVLALVLIPTISWLTRGALPDTRYRRGEAPAIYEFFAAQPKSILVASVSDVADFIPPLARRSVVVSPKYALPYHSGYYRQIRARARDLIRAQYSTDLRELQDVNRKYGVDYWLVRRSAFSPQYVRDSWMMEIQPEAGRTLERLREGVTPAMAKLLDRCAVLSAGSLVVVRAACIAESPSADVQTEIRGRQTLG